MAKCIIFLLSFFCLIVYGNAQSVVEISRTLVKSPDERYHLTFYQKLNADSTKTLYYSVQYKNLPVVLESIMDIQLDNNLSERAMALKVDKHERWCENLKFQKFTSSNVDTTWVPVYGERSRVVEKYNAVTVEMVKDDNPMYVIHVELRAYNEGVAFRFFFPENPKGTYYRVMSENTEFVLPAGTRGWHHSWAQGPFKLLAIEDFPDECERPLTLELPGGLYACLAEAKMVDYARTKFKVSRERPNTLLTSMYTPADLISPFGTPWRVIMAGEKPGDLVENNDLLLNLNAPSGIKDVSWIKPGKIMRVMTQTTKDAFENIDFAAKRGLQYILFDWKWYGPAFSFSSDATKVAIPDFDLPAIIKYGNEKGIGVWLYVNQQALLTQSDSLFRVYRDWGIKGVKFGFVQVGSHRWTTWIEDMFRRAAESKIMVNVHDDWRQTGEQRTWPNLMTAEGIRGNEEMPDATHNTILPFTRFIAGAADYTLCYYDKRIKTTHAHQLAMAAVYYSPIQTLYWYDKPAMSNDEPELEFWDKIPTTWDETKVLGGTPGKSATVARRSGNTWYVGHLGNNDGGNVVVDLSFLEPTKKYRLTIYSDGPKATTPTKVNVERRVVAHADKLPFIILPSGGLALILSPF